MNHLFKQIKSTSIYQYIYTVLQCYFRKGGTILAKGIAYSFLITANPNLRLADLSFFFLRQHWHTFCFIF